MCKFVISVLSRTENSEQCLYEEMSHNVQNCIPRCVWWWSKTFFGYCSCPLFFNLTKNYTSLSDFRLMQHFVVEQGKTRPKRVVSVLRDKSVPTIPWCVNTKERGAWNKNEILSRVTNSIPIVLHALPSLTRPLQYSREGEREGGGFNTLARD